MVAVLFADNPAEEDALLSIIAMRREESEGCFAGPATSSSG
jgi:hypothetical protein